MKVPSRFRCAGLMAVFALAAAGPLTAGVALSVPATKAAESLSAAQRDFMTWRFGLFVHFNLGTFADLDWAGGYEDPALFNPAKLDCGQWADAAKDAGMRYMVLTVKHTEGIALYDSAATTHDITKFKNFRQGRGDIVREFVDACRSRGLKVGLYYCFPGDYADAAHHNAPPAGQPDLHGLPPEAIGDYVGFMKKQLRELLTNYGPIDLLWIDQYANRYTAAQWPELLAFIKSLQPRCVVDANNARNLRDSDVLSYEFPWQQMLPPIDSSLPGQVCDTIQTGARWFWREAKSPSDLQPAAAVFERLHRCNERNANYLLNVPPDRDGLISGAHLQRLKEIGALVREAAVRPPSAPLTVSGQIAPSPPPATAIWGTDLRDALAAAKAQNRHVLLLFTGSDWCSWCRRLQAEVLSTPEFVRYAAEHLILVELDFPKEKPQPMALKAQNAAASRRFTIEVYPTVVVLDSAGEPVAKLGYQAGGPGPFVAALSKL